MEAVEKLLKFKFHLLGAAAAVSLAAAIYYAAPNFVTVVTYFWPLLVSTALFLAAVVFFGRVTPVESAGDAGGELLDYVAGKPEDAIPEGAQKLE
ncbi:hypothetical protein H6P81_014826 [Aristolochia fimbriata]|uniref:Dolichol-phosphate mannosyltransferase subunit 3 n=1 Tax=Aristolochia fimbriata TaxID=158543 RepID=A0AAV7E6M6_ARIFI|nr:hypothetical protein H6P81_014826 [Aristolochia fimbriata]